MLNISCPIQTLPPLLNDLLFVKQGNREYVKQPYNSLKDKKQIYIINMLLFSILDGVSVEKSDFFSD